MLKQHINPVGKIEIVEVSDGSTIITLEMGRLGRHQPDGTAT